jgi:capsular polysaccharide export protein
MRAPVRRFLSNRVALRAPRRFAADAPPHRLSWSAPGVMTGVTTDVTTGVTTSVRHVSEGLLRLPGADAGRVPPLSLMLDRTGAPEDPDRPSELEAAILRAAALPPEALERARGLRESLAASHRADQDRRPLPNLPGRPVLLVAGDGQPSDDVSLLHAARAAEPDAFLLYMPHPDAGPGLPDATAEAAGADRIARCLQGGRLIAGASAVWTRASSAGFEALLRGVPVTTLGAPFYAGWGLTRDLGRPPVRRRAARPSLDALVQAVLIDCTRYFDPVLGMACPPETALRRILYGPVPRPGPARIALSRLADAFAVRVPL